MLVIVSEPQSLVIILGQLSIFSRLRSMRKDPARTNRKGDSSRNTPDRLRFQSIIRQFQRCS